MEDKIMCKYFPSITCYTGDPTTCFDVYNEDNPTCPYVNPKVTTPTLKIIEDQQKIYYNKVLKKIIIKNNIEKTKTAIPVL